MGLLKKLIKAPLKLHKKVLGGAKKAVKATTPGMGGGGKKQPHVMGGGGGKIGIGKTRMR